MPMGIDTTKTINIKFAILCFSEYQFKQLFHNETSVSDLLERFTEIENTFPNLLNSTFDLNDVSYTYL